MAVVATLSKGYDLEYIWKQVDRGPAQDAARYYIQASECGGQPPGRWWGPGAKALGFEPKAAPMYAQMLVGMVGTTGQWWLDARKPSKDAVAAHLVNLAWHGLGNLERKPRLRSKP